MFTQEKFEANRIEASRAELAVVELLKRRGNDAWLNSLNYDWCDIWTRTANGCVPVEVKTGYESMYTGNIAIEQKTLDHTRSQYFVYVLPQAYVLSRPKLKILASMSRPITGGDSQYQLYLPTKAQFMQEAQLMNPQ